jgi:hypothetical protein
MVFFSVLFGIAIGAAAVITLKEYHTERVSRQGAVKREAEEDWGRGDGDKAGQDAICVWHGRTSHFPDRRASSSRSMQKSEEHL